MVTSLWSKHHQKRSPIKKRSLCHPLSLRPLRRSGGTSGSRGYSCTTWDMHKLKEIAMMYAGMPGYWAFWFWWSKPSRNALNIPRKFRACICPGRRCLRNDTGSLQRSPLMAYLRSHPKQKTARFGQPQRCCEQILAGYRPYGSTRGTSDATWRSTNPVSRRSNWKNKAVFLPEITLLKIGTYFRRNCPTDSSIPMIAGSTPTPCRRSGSNSWPHSP
jgi:hypothetical protein